MTDPGVLGLAEVGDLAASWWWTLSTIVAFASFRRWAARRHRIVAQPVVLTAVGAWAVAAVIGESASGYREHTDILVTMLAPATVALGVPMAARLRAAGARLVPMLVAVVFGGLVASGSAVGVAWLLDGPDEMRLPLAAKSITTPIALAVTDPEGADPGIVAGLVILTGVAGAIVVEPLLRRLKVRGRPVGAEAVGLSMGTTAHAIGTASLAGRLPVAVGSGGLALAVNGVATSLWLPAFVALASS